MTRSSPSAVPTGLNGIARSLPTDKSVGYSHVFPPGPNGIARSFPTDKSVGYSHVSLRDRTRMGGYLEFDGCGDLLKHDPPLVSIF